MALIGNPMDFDRIRQKYESIVYPQGRTLDNNFNQVRDSYSGLLNQPGVLTGMGSQTISQDATQPGQQVQLRFNPATGQTETIIPEYMGGFRSDQQDFLPNTSPFQTIYDIDAGNIDPVTGTPKPDPIVTDPGSGQTTSLLAMGGGGGRDSDVARPDNYNFVGGSFVNTDRLNEDGSIAFGMHQMLPGILGAPATIARAFTSPARQLATLKNISAMNMDYTQQAGLGYSNKAASDIARLARDVQNRAENRGDVDTAVDAAKLASGYTGLSRDKAQEAMDAAAAEAEEGGIVNSIQGFFSGLFGVGAGVAGSGGGTGGTTGGTTGGVSGAGTDGTGGPDSQYGGGGAGGTGRGGNFGGDTAGSGTDASTAGGTGGRRGGAGGGSGSGGGSGGGVGGSGPAGCFVEGTAIQMADGSTKEITTIKVGEETKGGIVQAKMEFMPQNIYNYKDVLVSGSHWVVENNQLIAVEDSKHAILTDRIEPVYTFKTSDNRIWINDIEFGDFETGTDEDWEPHFEMVRQKLNKELRDGK